MTTTEECRYSSMSQQGSEWSVSCPGSFTRGERALVTLRIAGWVNARTDAVAPANNNNSKDDDVDDDDNNNNHKTFIMGNNIT
jgi:hypothetical protein